MGWGSTGWGIKFSNHTILETHKTQTQENTRHKLESFERALHYKCFCFCRWSFVDLASSSSSYSTCVHSFCFCGFSGFLNKILEILLY